MNNENKFPNIIWLAQYGGGMGGITSDWFKNKKSAEEFIKGQYNGTIAGPYVLKVK